MNTQANRYELALAKRAEGISQNLHQALQTHNRYANDDITTALIEHARSSIMYERQLLRELEALRGDVSSAAKKVVAAANGVPKPSIVPPLENFSDRTRVEPASSALINGFHKATQSQAPHTAGLLADNGGPQGFTPHKLPNQSQAPVPSLFPQSRLGRQEPLSPASAQSSSSGRDPFSSASSQHSQHSPSSPLPPQSPGAGPSTPTISPERQSAPRPPVNEAPLGGHFVDGTKSMFVTRSASIPRPSPLSVSSSTSNIPGPNVPFDPLRNDSYTAPVSSPLHTGPSQQASQTQETDPLGSIRPHQMSSSVRVQPTRPRLDAREAASKLANMF